MKELKTLARILKDSDDAELVKEGIVVYCDPETGKYKITVEVPVFYTTPDSMTKEEALSVVERLNRYDFATILREGLKPWEGHNP